MLEDHKQFLQQPKVIETLATLKRDADLEFNSLLSTFKQLDEISVKLKLQKIATLHETIVCLTKLPQPKA